MNNKDPWRSPSNRCEICGKLSYGNGRYFCADGVRPQEETAGLWDWKTPCCRFVEIAPLEGER